MTRKHQHDVAQPSPAVHPPAGDNALAVAIEQNDWERAALLLLIGFARTLEQFQPGTIDDVLALFDGEEDSDAALRS